LEAHGSACKYFKTSEGGENGSFAKPLYGLKPVSRVQRSSFVADKAEFRCTKPHKSSHTQLSQTEAKLLRRGGIKALSRDHGKCDRSFLSPLRLPVPPSRLYVEVLDYTAYFKPIPSSLNRRHYTVANFTRLNLFVETLDLLIRWRFYHSLSLEEDTAIRSSHGDCKRCRVSKYQMRPQIG
jgi:hypothetical protein